MLCFNPPGSSLGMQYMCREQANQFSSHCLLPLSSTCKKIILDVHTHSRRGKKITSVALIKTLECFFFFVQRFHHPPHCQHLFTPSISSHLNRITKNHTAMSVMPICWAMYGAAFYYYILYFCCKTEQLSALCWDYIESSDSDVVYKCFNMYSVV